MKKGKRKILVAYNAPRSSRIRDDAVAEESVVESAEDIVKELRKRSWNAKTMPVSSPIVKTIETVSDERPDAVFNLCEGFDGDPGMEMNMAALWELLGVPSTGCNARTLALSQDKSKAKTLAADAGVRTPDHELMHAPGEKTSLGFPLVVKPPTEDGSIGVTLKSFARNSKELDSAVSETISRYGAPAMAEKYVDGREFNVAAFGSDEIVILPPAETEFRNFPKSIPKITTYETKWDSGSEFYRKTESVCPARIPLRLAEELKRITLKLYKIFEADSYARADFRMDARGRIFFLEFNPNPDISPSSGFRKALSAARIPFGTFAEELVKTAERRRRNRK